MTLTQRDILRALSEHGEGTIRMIGEHVGADIPRQTLACRLTDLRATGCVSARKKGDGCSRWWSITPRGMQWLSLLDASGCDTVPPCTLYRALTIWLLEHPGEHRTSEIESVPEIDRLLTGYVANSVVCNTLNRLESRGLVSRRLPVPKGPGRPCVLWSIVGTEMTEPRPRVPRNAPPGYWDEHWQEIEQRFRSVMIGRRPMLQVTLKREIRAEEFPQGVIREATERGLISVSWVRGQQYYTLVG